MKVEITELGVFVPTEKSGEQELAIGTVLNLGAGITEVPGSLVSKCRVIGKAVKNAEFVAAETKGKKA